MTSSIKRIGLFGVFLPAAMALFWPYFLIILALFSFILTYTVDPSILSVIWGESMPLKPFTAVFTLPIYLLFSVPYFFVLNGGLSVLQHETLNHLLSLGVYTSMGLLFTAVIVANIIGWSAYALKQTFNNTWREVIIGTSLILFSIIALVFSF